MKINLLTFIPGLILIVLILSGCSPALSTPTAPETEIPSMDLPAAETPVPIFMTPTPSLDMWTTFSNPAFAISLQYPGDWLPVTGYGSSEMGEIRFAAINGFFQIGAMDSDSIDLAAAAEAEHRLQPYGSQPIIETLQIQEQDARLIIPSDDQPTGMQNQATLIIRYPQPVNVIGTPCRYFVLYADFPHIRTIAQTLVFTN